jgi:hypothetical protein
MPVDNRTIAYSPIVDREGRIEFFIELKNAGSPGLAGLIGFGSGHDGSVKKD